jgi:hypothetical protein
VLKLPESHPGPFPSAYVRNQVSGRETGSPDTLKPNGIRLQAASDNLIEYYKEKSLDG